MKNDIIEKLNNHILGGINREADVVYMLVQIRKILEHEIFKDEKIKDVYPTLILYCDWVLHTFIGDIKKSGQILDKIEMAIALLDADDPDKAIININEAISFVNFQRNLKDYFSKNKLTFFTDENYTILLRLLIEILKDIPLLAKDNKFKFSFASGDKMNSFHARIELADKRVYRSPMTPIVTNWTVGIVAPSGAYEPENSEK